MARFLATLFLLPFFLVGTALCYVLYCLLIWPFVKIAEADKGDL